MTAVEDKQVKKIKFEIPFIPKGKQIDFYKAGGRFAVFCTGRQFGKTTLSLLRLVMRALSKKGVYWWVAPTYSQARIVFRRCLQSYEGIIADFHKSLLEVWLVNGSSIQFKSGESSENLRGETLHGVSIDEAAQLPPDFFETIIRPMLTTTNGWADFMSTPKGKNWFYDMAVRAQHSSDSKEYSFFSASSYESPFISEKELDDIRQKTPEAIFRQEYLAEFIDEDGYVFKNVSECATGSFEPYNEDCLYVAGLDLARLHDYTVLTIFRIDGDLHNLVYYERFNNLSWSMQVEKIASRLIEYGNPLCNVDATGVGDPVFEMLKRKELHVRDIKITQTNKSHMIERMMLVFEQKKIRFPHHSDIIAELMTFSALDRRGSYVTYGAPAGYHDDIVMSMALALYGASRSRPAKFVEL